MAAVRQASQFISAPDAQNFDLATLALKKSDEKLLVDQPWTTRPFLTTSPIQLPVFNFLTGQFTGQIANLDPEIYNLPLRRDIVHLVHMYFQNLNKQTYKRALTRGDVSGSGTKMRPQKKSGRARQGDKRAPHLWKGGKAHGAKPVNYTYPLNEKVRLTGLKTLLTARVFEEKIILIDTEQIEYGKTKFLNEIIKPFKTDKLLFLTGFELDKNFELAAQNITNLTHMNPHEFHVPSILKHDWILATVKGLQDLEMLIENKEANLYRNRKVPRAKLPYDDIIKPSIIRQQNKHDHFEDDIIKGILEREQWEDENKPLEIFSESLKGYIKDVQTLQQEHKKNLTA